jgi:hypothetical protein
MNDDDRISYLSGEDGVDVDDALWAVPPTGLEDSIVAAIASEAAERPAPTAAAPTAAAPTTPPPPPMGGTVTSLATHRARRIRNYLTAAAAVVVLAVGGVFVATRDRGSDGTAVALQSGQFGPGASGTAHVKRFDSGWRVMLDATGLPRLDDGEFYEAWLKDANGVLVPIGTFNEGADVVLWAGVSPVTFSTLTVTKETADGNQDSSRQVVLSGTITLDDAATS